MVLFREDSKNRILEGLKRREHAVWSEHHYKDTIILAFVVVLGYYF